MAQTLDAIMDRVRSLCVGDPFAFVEAQTPFSFAQQPVGEIDGCFRIVDRSGPRVKGGFSYSETRVDMVDIWVAKRFDSDPTQAKRVLTRQMHSLTAAVVRDGHENGGDYAVEDDRQHRIQAEDGAAYAVLQLSIPVNYESQL